ncbi:MAG TPA: pyridoxal phosphate-dependent aminotransferase [Terriglobales bacterium]
MAATASHAARFSLGKAAPSPHPCAGVAIRFQIIPYPDKVFSARTGWPLHPNRLHQLAAARGARTLIDLTVANPTQCGFEYPRAQLLAALGHAAALRYQPQPLGLESARAAVSAYYAERNASPVPTNRLLLTASTSEAYAHLFRLLCDPGDAVLMPAPSYPLFEMLATMSDVRLLACPMLYDRGWQLDREALEHAAGSEPKLRALLLVHPNNPAGCYLKPGEWQWLQELAARCGWALVLDEVFFDYPLPPHAAVPLDWESAPALTFVLNGLSKIAALPQMKLGWVSVHGPGNLRQPALARLEILNDLFLSVDAPIQHAAATFLQTRHGVQAQIRARLAANLAALDAALLACPALERLQVEGGWNVILRLPRVRTDDAWAELVLERAGVLTHPGHFYSLPLESHLVISLLPPLETFQAGIEALVAAAAGALR